MSIKNAIEAKLSKRILNFSPLSGGDINEVFLVQTKKAKFVVKRNTKSSYPKMFSKEAQGLLLLKKVVNTPQVIDWFETEKDQLIIMEYIQNEQIQASYWSKFGHDLSALHQTRNNDFGLDHDNYIGSLNQKNNLTNSWEDFFVEYRIKPLLKLAFDKNLLNKGHLESFQLLFSKYSSLVPVEPPSLLHGDLWSGNMICGINQTPVFIDPAVYFGHREVDIAMTHLFGGFDFAYIDHYIERYPLEKGWESRIGIHNLYPNLVHLILFGSTYLRSIEKVLSRYS